MNIALGSDHAGLDLKNRITKWLSEQGIHVEDIGPYKDVAVDYADFAQVVAEKVATGEHEKGILVCGTGIGMSIAANKVHGIRAALCYDERTAAFSKEHNDANILCLGGRLLETEQAFGIVQTWLKSTFEGGRHARRVNKIHEIESLPQGSISTDPA